MARRTNKSKERESDKKDDKRSNGNKLDQADPKSQGGEDPEAEKKGKNDVEWYARDPQLLLDASRFTYAEVFGGRYRMDSKSAGYSGGTVSVPNTLSSRYSGIYTYTAKATIGDTQHAKDPANIAASMLYAHVRYVNSGRKNYDPADLYLYTLTIAELYSIVAFSQKLYGAAFMYSQRNLFIGKAVIEALGFDAEDLRTNLANFRAWINTFINKVSSYAVPSEVPYFFLKLQMFSSLYIENGEENIKDQLYQVKPAGFYKFQLDDSHDGAGMLSFHPMIPSSGTNFTVETWIKYAEDFFSNIWADEDFGLISGDIHKAFDGKILGLVPQADEGGLSVLWDPFMLEKFHNARVYPVVGGSGTYTVDGVANPFKCGDIYQLSDGNLLMHEFKQSNGGAYDAAYQCVIGNSLTMLDLHSPDADPAKVVESTRWTSVLGDYMSVTINGTASNLPKIICGTEIITGIDVSVITDDEWSAAPKMTIIKNVLPVLLMERTVSGNTYQLKTVMREDPDTSSARSIAECEWMLSALLGGEYVPIVHMIIGGQAGAIWQVKSDTIISQISNFTYVRPEQLARLHEVALLSLLSVPGVAKLMV